MCVCVTRSLPCCLSSCRLHVLLLHRDRLCFISSHLQQLIQGRFTGWRGANFPFPGRISQLWLEDPMAFPGQCGDTISPASPGSAPPRGPFPCWPCLGNPCWGRRLTRCPLKTTSLAPFRAKEQRLYFALSLNTFVYA